ncbi:MAG: orotidine 5'-phosphate decarboxylase [Bifidobacterium sp.]|jgi:3-hexulose-6-phosphate synthase|nr:orotidine 5'-phosphate decarboxylase [Bifidobacterium sp.]MCH4174846.1 orotidine 5'-phosphate decarboxylase [Bifidobacterium sp.]
MMMKLQVAIDRVDLAKAEEFVRELRGEVDIIEMGTSLTMEFGVRSLAPLVSLAGDTPMLGDIKTCDEGAYEFDTGFSCGFSYLTVMGAASIETVRTCYESTARHGRRMMIDLIGCDEERVTMLSEFSDAIFYLHTSIDAPQPPSPLQEIRAFKRDFPSVRHIAISADGNLEEIGDLSREGVEILIMGPTINTAADPKAACRSVMARWR